MKQSEQEKENSLGKYINRIKKLTAGDGYKRFLKIISQEPPGAIDSTRNSHPKPQMTEWSTDLEQQLNHVMLQILYYKTYLLN